MTAPVTCHDSSCSHCVDKLCSRDSCSRHMCNQTVTRSQQCKERVYLAVRGLCQGKVPQVHHARARYTPCTNAFNKYMLLRRAGLCRSYSAPHLVPAHAARHRALLEEHGQAEDEAPHNAGAGQALLHARVHLVEHARHADEQRRLQLLRARAARSAHAAAG